MTAVGQVEKKTQQRIVKLFREDLNYDYLGDWTDREGNANIEPALLHAWLKKRGEDETLIGRTLFVLNMALAVDHAINENRQDDWRGNSFKVKKVKLAIKPLLHDDEERTERILELAKNQHEY